MPPPLKLAAVDIGSHAVRLQVSSVLVGEGEQPKFKRIEYLRFPLRLGHDVFRHRCISAESSRRLLQLLQAFKILIELYDVDAYKVCATAAFREASNQQEIVHYIQQTIDVVIHIVGGEEEALLIHSAIRHLLEEPTNYLHVDVGGGSTEINLYQGGQKVASRSFDVGTLRTIEHDHIASVREAMRTWIVTKTQHFNTLPIGIATGGNIRKLAQLAKKGMRKPLSLKKLESTKDQIAGYSLEERINYLALNPDRADVILPALEIYNAAMRFGGVEKILVPDVSLRDGIIRVLYEQSRDCHAMG